MGAHCNERRHVLAVSLGTTAALHRIRCESLAGARWTSDDPCVRVYVSRDRRNTYYYVSMLCTASPAVVQLANNIGNCNTSQTHERRRPNCGMMRARPSRATFTAPPRSAHRQSTSTSGTSSRSWHMPGTSPRAAAAKMLSIAALDAEENPRGNERDPVNGGGPVPGGPLNRAFPPLLMLPPPPPPPPARTLAGGSLRPLVPLPFRAHTGGHAGEHKDSLVHTDVCIHGRSGREDSGSGIEEDFVNSDPCPVLPPS